MKPGDNCKRCKRLFKYRQEVKTRFPDYLCQPVCGIGPGDSQFLIVGLAPGLHGANATGIPFTGDASGKLLFHCLDKFGFLDPVQAEDDLGLVNCRITNAVKCLPPQNKPTSLEVKTCNRFLKTELSTLADQGVVLALGKVAHDAVLKSLDLVLKSFKFGHKRIHYLDNGLRLVDSYHCSRYNIQTKRLTVEQFEDVFLEISQLLNS